MPGGRPMREVADFGWQKWLWRDFAGGIRPRMTRGDAAAVYVTVLSTLTRATLTGAAFTTATVAWGIK
jgi:hypothetical protein